MRKIFAVMGKASTGKDTLTKMLSETLELPIALSFTTRPMRVGEKQGVEYNFISDDDFWDLHGCDLLAEYTSYEVASGETWHYGLTKEELEKAEECCRRFLADNKDFKDISTNHHITNVGDLKSVYKKLESMVRIEIGNDLLKKVNEDFRSHTRSFLCK